MTMRIAMWSGPRSLSTAMMRSFGNRSDTFVWDEPFYGAYLHLTGLNHPMRAEILAACETDWRRIMQECLTRTMPGRPVFYQKHMTHHMLPQIDQGWLANLTNVFLIRRPDKVVASYAAKRETVTPDDIGFAHMRDLFEAVAGRLGRAPLVIDADAVLGAPRAMLEPLCKALGIDFQDSMLTWPAGARPGDGIWAAHWYGSVVNSTSFARPDDRRIALDPQRQAVADAAQPHYDYLHQFALAAEPAATA